MGNYMTQEINGFKRIFKMDCAYHDLSKDLDSRGLGGAIFRFYLIKDFCAVQFVFSPGIYLELTYKLDPDISLRACGEDLGYHSPYPQYKGQKKRCDYCDINESTCYYDGSTCQSQEVLEIFISEGMDAMWKYLEGFWKERFNTVKKNIEKEAK